MFTRARFQIAAAYAVILAATIGILGAAAYGVARHQLDDEINRSLSVALADAERFRSTAPPAATPTPAGNGDDHSDGEDDDGDGGGHGYDDDEPVLGISPDVFFVTTDASGSVLENPRRVDLAGISFSSLIDRYEEGNARRDVRGEDGRFRMLATRTSEGGAAYLFVGRSLEARDRQLRTLAMVFIAGGALALIVSGAGGYWLAGRTLSPIQRSLKMQRQFVSDASHELRTPISVVQANNELLLRHPDQTIEGNLDQVEAIAVETDHMARLVGDLLTLARADEGQAELAREDVDLSVIASEVTRDMEPLAESRGVSLEGSFAGSARVDGDRQRLRQLVTILVDNGLKYTPAGGHVSVSCQQVGRNVELAVSDTGPGIAPADQERVFDRFYRVDKSRARSEGGTGLGLAIARWIAEAHDGRLTLQSRPGEGSTFTLRVPRAG